MTRMVALARRPRTASGGLVEILKDCHARVRTFVAMAVGAGERLELPTDEVVAACHAIERYFTVALPLHIRDEEESIAPRLAGRRPDIDAALDDMHREHGGHEPLIRSLLEACEAVRGTPEDAGKRGILAAAARTLRPYLLEHLAAEEEVLFRAIDTLLSDAERTEILGELRARRAALEEVTMRPEIFTQLVEDVARDANRIIPELDREVARVLAREALSSDDLWYAASRFALTAASHVRPLGRRDDLEERLADVVRWNLDAA